MISTTSAIGTPSSRPSISNTSIRSVTPPWAAPSARSGQGADMGPSCRERVGIEDQNGGRVPEIGGSRDTGQVAQPATDRLDDDILPAHQTVHDDSDPLSLIPGDHDEAAVLRGPLLPEIPARRRRAIQAH